MNGSAGSRSTKDWLADVRKNSPARLQELDFLLRALDGFSDTDAVGELMSETGPIADYSAPAQVIHDGVLNLVGLLEMIIPENRRNRYWFERYAKNKYLPAERKTPLYSEREEDSPEESLLKLYDGFLNIKGLTAEILRAERVSGNAFDGVGRMVRREIARNKFFNPFMRRKLDPVVDGVRNPTLSALVRKIDDRDLRRAVSLAMLGLFRILRYLEYVDARGFKRSVLNVSLLAFVLVETQLHLFQSLCKRREEVGISDEDVGDTLSMLHMQVSMESKRVYAQELRHALDVKDTGQLRGRIENSLGILKNLAEQSVVALAQAIDPTVAGEQVFASFVTRLEQSAQLRDDLMVLHRMLELFEEDNAHRKRTFGGLLNYMHYFEEVTFKLLRYNDYEGFAAFFSWFKSTDSADLGHMRRLEDILSRIAHFRIYLETTLQHVGLRAELAHFPPDLYELDQTVRQYMPV